MTKKILTHKTQGKNIKTNFIGKSKKQLKYLKTTKKVNKRASKKTKTQRGGSTENYSFSYIDNATRKDVNMNISFNSSVIPSYITFNTERTQGADYTPADDFIAKVKQFAGINIQKPFSEEQFYTELINDFSHKNCQTTQNESSLKEMKYVMQILLELERILTSITTQNGNTPRDERYINDMIDKCDKTIGNYMKLRDTTGAIEIDDIYITANQAMPRQAMTRQAMTENLYGSPGADFNNNTDTKKLSKTEVDKFLCRHFAIVIDIDTILKQAIYGICVTAQNKKICLDEVIIPSNLLHFFKSYAYLISLLTYFKNKKTPVFFTSNNLSRTVFKKFLTSSEKLSNDIIANLLRGNDVSLFQPNGERFNIQAAQSDGFQFLDKYLLFHDTVKDFPTKIPKEGPVKGTQFVNDIIGKLNERLKRDTTTTHPEIILFILSTTTLDKLGTEIPFVPPKSEGISEDFIRVDTLVYNKHPLSDYDYA